MAQDNGQDENGSKNDEERVLVGARISKKKKKQIEDQLSYGDHIQNWVEDAIDRKLAATTGDGGYQEGNSKMRTETGPTSD